MVIEVNNNNYIIDDEIWSLHELIHPIRPKDVLLSNIKLTLEDSQINSQNIEQIIKDEYDMLSNINQVIDNARDMYDK